MDYEKVRLEDIAIGNAEEMELVLLRNRGEGKLDRIRRGINTADAIWYLFCAAREKILEQGAEIAELREAVEKLKGAKPARAEKKARAA